MSVEIVPIPLLTDNYGYLVVAGTSAAVVDPSEAAPVERVLTERGLVLDAIWCTHHHWDHVGGIEALVAARPALPVLASAYDREHGRVPRQTRGLREGDSVTHGGARFDVLEIPGHTLGAIAFVGEGAAFTGDTLFLGGCGRVFEGTMPMMQASLARLAALPPSTRIYCGHEYTVKNLEFASTVEPDNAAIAAQLERARAARARGEPTVPGTLADDLAVSPMLRWSSDAVRAFAAARGGASSDAAVFARVREAKDAF